MMVMGRDRAPTAGGGGAMASDAAALYWYSPSNVTTSSGDLTGWPDNTGNGMDLAQHTTENVPGWDAGGFATFDGTQMLADVTTGLTGRAVGELNAGNDMAMFMVVEMDTSGQADNSYAAYDVGLETSADAGSNQALKVSLIQDNFGADNTIVGCRLRRFSDAVNAEWNPGTDQSGVKMLVEFWANQTNYELIINGTQRASGSVTAANLPNGTDVIIALGGAADDTLAAPAFIGNIYEVFVTGDSGSSNRGAIRSELATAHGITLP